MQLTKTKNNIVRHSGGEGTSLFVYRPQTEDDNRNVHPQFCISHTTKGRTLSFDLDFEPLPIHLRVPVRRPFSGSVLRLGRTRAYRG